MLVNQNRTKQLFQTISRFFGAGGPYNPHRYRDYSAPKNYPTNEEIENFLVTVHQLPNYPVRNMRHVSPIRQSGPMPLYDGAFNMEDMKKIFYNATFPNDKHPCSMDVEELMRRVPGVTRELADKVTSLGLTPDEEVHYAYLSKSYVNSNRSLPIGFKDLYTKYSDAI